MPRKVTVMCGDTRLLVGEDFDAFCLGIAEDAYDLETRPMRSMDDALCMELATRGPDRLQKTLLARVVSHLVKIGLDRFGFQMKFVGTTHEASSDFHGIEANIHWKLENRFFPESFSWEQKAMVANEFMSRTDAIFCSILLDFDNRKIGWSAKPSPWGVTRKACNTLRYSMERIPANTDSSQLLQLVWDTGLDPSKHSHVLAMKVSSIPHSYAVSCGLRSRCVAEAAALGGPPLQDDGVVKIWNRMDSMVVDEKTTVATVAKFLRGCNYDFYDTCDMCKRIVGFRKKTVRCGSCATTFCPSCTASSYDERTCTLRECAKCGEKQVRARSLCRFVSGSYSVNELHLYSTQIWRSREMPDKNCGKCGKGGCKAMCPCVRSTRYCSAECQKEDWALHKRICTLHGNNTSCGWVKDFGPGGSDKEVVVTTLVPVIRDVAMWPISAILMLNVAKARKVHMRRKRQQRELQQQ